MRCTLVIHACKMSKYLYQSYWLLLITQQLTFRSGGFSSSSSSSSSTSSCIPNFILMYFPMSMLTWPSFSTTSSISSCEQKWPGSNSRHSRRRAGRDSTKRRSLTILFTCSRLLVVFVFAWQKKERKINIKKGLIVMANSVF